MLSIVRACAIIGLEGEVVLVETDFNPRAQLPTSNSEEPSSTTTILPVGSSVTFGIR